MKTYVSILFISALAFTVIVDETTARTNRDPYDVFIERMKDVPMKCRCQESQTEVKNCVCSFPSSSELSQFRREQQYQRQEFVRKQRQIQNELWEKERVKPYVKPTQKDPDPALSEKLKNVNILK